MTDNDIIKALECCIQPMSNCEKCPLYKVSDECFDIAKNGTVDIINRQKAEIERLKGWKRLLKAESHAPIIKKAKAEAVKEFAEKAHSLIHPEYDKLHKQLDDLLKEMVGDADG